MSQKFSLVSWQALRSISTVLLAISLSTTTFSAQAASTVATTEPVTAPTAAPKPALETAATLAAKATTANSVRPATTTDAEGRPTLAAQLQPTDKALSAANQQLLSRNAQLQRQVNDLQTQTNVLIYESQGQLFLYGAFTVLISLLVGIFVSWLVFVRRERW